MICRRPVGVQNLYNLLGHMNLSAILSAKLRFASGERQ